jgi:hypothetical protein
MENRMTTHRSSPDSSALQEVYDALTQAQDCIRGETPEDMTDAEAREDTIDKVRDAMRTIEAMQVAGVAQSPLREALEKLRSYNVDIHMGRINYRPWDHIAVIDRALSPVSSKPRGQS